MGSDEEAKLGWRYFKSSFYYISVESKNWTTSAVDCVQRGANLVIISTTEEQVCVCVCFIILTLYGSNVLTTMEICLF